MITTSLTLWRAFLLAPNTDETICSLNPISSNHQNGTQKKQMRPKMSLNPSLMTTLSVYNNKLDSHRLAAWTRLDQKNELILEIYKYINVLYSNKR